MTSHNFFRLLGFVGLGWKDIHATNIDEPDKDYKVKPHIEISVKY